MNTVQEHYARHLDRVDELVRREVARWRRDEVEHLVGLADAHLQRRGKRLRPLLSFAVTDLLGGDLALATMPAASVELYHLAALIVDDVQDNSETRRGEPSVHKATSKSTAINLALFVRSLSYQLVGQFPDTDLERKLRLYRELDGAATRIVLGQSVDIGWQEGWYSSFSDYPYAHMIEWKTGALFGCAAAMGACVAGADHHTVGAARDYGISFGAFYQMVDDFLDAFGDGSFLRKPPHEDFREGKMTEPLIRLLCALQKAGHSATADLVLRQLGHGESATDGWGWLLDLMREHDVQSELRHDLAERATTLASPPFGARAAGSSSLRLLVDQIVEPALR